MRPLIHSIALALRRGLPVLAWAALALPFVSCVENRYSRPSRHAQVERRGPPAHAPAHGYRRKHEETHERARLPQGVKLVFDRQLGVYVLLGLADHYYDGHRYYRRRHDEWQASLELDRGWARLAIGSLPRGLRAGKQHSYRRKHARGRGHARGHGNYEVPADADD